MRAVGIDRSSTAKHLIAARGQSAYKPVRLHRVVKPGLSPSGANTRTNGSTGNQLPIVIKKGQFPTRLQQTPLEIFPLSCRWATAQKFIFWHLISRVLAYIAHIQPAMCVRE